MSDIIQKISTEKLFPLQSLNFSTPKIGEKRRHENCYFSSQHNISKRKLTELRFQCFHVEHIIFGSLTFENLYFLNEKTFSTLMFARAKAPPN